jgi:hypothetical protein
MSDPPATRGLTVREVARRYRLGKDRVLAMIRSGALRALNLAPSRCGRPRYVIMPDALRQWEQANQVSPPPPPRRRQKRSYEVDYFPD